MLNDWAEAWSTQDVDTYLSFYGEEFLPPRGLSRSQWRRERRRRLTSPAWIRVELNGLKVLHQTDKQVIVELTQDYTAPGYSDRTVKQFVLTQANDGLRIRKEVSVKTLP